MSKQTFSWKPDLAAEAKMKPNVTVTKFGDGYEHRVAVGINFKPKSWNLTFTRNYAEISQIIAFLDARGAVESFNWKDTTDVTGVYVCREWSYSQTKPGVYQLNCTFDQVFEY